ncbi:MAG TPA: hypothetical protein VFH73_05740 [Polyangia bacterium]|jgi:hypothetical protein|nr:hypothetical protein [Polyangia bacterium]
MRNVMHIGQRRTRAAALVLCCLAYGCGSSSPAGGRDGSAGGAHDSAGGGEAGRATGGSAGGGAGGRDAGAGGSGGSATTGTGGSDAGSGGAGGGPQGTQPIGAVCANTGNCSQTSGAAVCCVNTCLLSAECPNNNFVQCDPAPTYACRTGRCCRATAGGQTMYYCTKNNGCSGTFVP